ncbi:MAG: AmmeMemoRadiSam system protein B [Dysgonamonadaceae bacterium]
MEKYNKDRMPAVAGQFYPAKADLLEKEVGNYFNEAIAKKHENVISVICPHAGYIFSGKVAASSYNQIDENVKYEHVFILASSHHYHFNGASVYCDGNFLMPYGVETVDTKLSKSLVENNPNLFTDDPAPHINEHSIEVQLPFLHYKLKNDFAIVPVILGTSDIETCRQIAEVLKPFLTKDNLFVISTDFSHYPHYDSATLVDATTEQAILENNPQKLLNILSENKKKQIFNLQTSLCGWTSVLTLLYMTENNPNYRYYGIDYRNSGDEKMYGNQHEVVGYWSIAVTENNSLEKDEFYLTDKDKTALLREARNSIEKLLAKKEVTQPDLSGCSDTVNAHCGAFVTLYNREKLRGCIGMIVSEVPLLKTVHYMALSAAKRDYRFSPVSAEELNEIDIEISVLSPLKKINDVSEIELGKHGIYIVKGHSSGVFLPQVAEETGWDLENYLGHCARDKAGIGWDGWKEAIIYTFTATVFGEKKTTH